MIFSTSSTTTGGNFFTFVYNSAPPPPPYTGSYLPAVIYVSGLEVNIETASVAELEATVQKIDTEVNALARLGNSACVRLEAKRPDHIKELRELQVKLNRVQQMLAKAAEPTPDKPEETSTEPNLVPEKPIEPEPTTESDFIQDRNKRLEAMRDREQKKFKQASSKIRALHRKIMGLVHPNKYPDSPHLRDLYDLANLARTNHDEQSLIALLAMAKQYHSTQGPLALLNFLRNKKTALSEQYRQMQSNLRRIQNSPPVAIHKCMQDGDEETALTLFDAILAQQRNALYSAIQQAEFQLSGVTGTFSDGSTQTKFFRV